MAQTWTVVKFKEEDTVEAVPTPWLLGNQCHWPPFTQDKVLQAIRKHEEPNTCWPLHYIEVFRNGTFDDYLRAWSKTKTAEYQSDLNSDSDTKLRKLRKKKVFSTSSDSTDDESRIGKCLPSPPRLKQKSNTNNNVGQLNVNIPVCEINDSHNEKGVTKSKLPDISSGDNISSNPICCCCVVHNTSDTLKNVLKQQVLIRHILNEVLEELGKIQIATLPVTPLENREMQSIFTNFPHFPINSDEKLKQFEEFLNEENNFISATKECSRIGGSNLYEFIKRCLSLIMSNKFASEFSWHGAKKKKIFGHLKLAELLLAASELNHMANNRKEAEEAVKKWLKRAKERDVVESKRNNNGIA